MSAYKFSSDATLIDIAIADMHEESREWVSKIDFWQEEIAFFQQLLDKNNLFKLIFGESKEATTPIRQLITFYKTGYLQEVKEMIGNHQQYLAGYLQQEPEHTGREYVVSHLKFRNQIHDFEVQFQAYKYRVFKHARLLAGVRKPEGKDLYSQKIETLHEELQYWQSNLVFWKTEMRFFQSLLEKKNKWAVDREDKEMVSRLQNRITYYSGEVIDNLHYNVEKQRKLMAKLLSGAVQGQEDAYLTGHRQLREEVLALQKSIRDLKLQLFSFSDRINEKIESLF